MSTPRLPATLALVAWTFLVWTTRINNIVADDSLDSGETAARLALSLSFTVLVVAVGWAYSKRAAWLRPATFALAGWTTAVWAVRAVRSDEHTSELKSLMRTSYAVFCLKKK